MGGGRAGGAFFSISAAPTKKGARPKAPQQRGRKKRNFAGVAAYYTPMGSGIKKNVAQGGCIACTGREAGTNVFKPPF